MLNKEKLEIGNQNHTSQKGITLIALIITIIVMLILVGVTINVALNGGLFDKAKDAAKEMEEKAMYEQIVMGMQLDDGKINIGETFNKAEEIFSKSGYEIDSEEGANYILLTVKGKNGTYIYTITDEKIIIGNEPPEPPQETNPVAGTYYMADMQMSITLNEDGAVTAPAELGLGDNPTYTYNDTTVTLNNGSNISFYKLTDNKILVDENQQILFAINRNGLKGEEISGTYIHANGTNPDYQLIIDSEEGTWLELNNGSEKGSGHYFYYNNVIYSSGSIMGRVNQDGTITSAGTVWTKQ